jgi:hypothetical protein
MAANAAHPNPAMKAILLLSVLCNLVLGLLLARQSVLTVGERARATLEDPVLQLTSPQDVPAPVNPPKVAKESSWNWVEHPDPAKLVENLRSVGCPEQTIQDIVCARLCRGMRQKLLTFISAQSQATPYWKTPAPDGFRQERLMRQSLTDQLDDTLETLFGSEGTRIRLRFGGLPPERYAPDESLPPEKAKLVRDINRRYRAAEAEANDPVPFGFTEPATEAQAKELARRKQAEIQQVLTPAEYQEYLLRNSPAAIYVRNRLPQAKSEDEFRKMVQVAAEFEMDLSGSRAFPRRYGLAPGDDEERAEAEREKAFQKRLAEALGEDRVAAQEQEEKARETTEREERSRRESVRRITEIGATAEQANAFYDRLMAMQPQLDARAKEMKIESSPEQRKAFEEVLKAEFERVATEIMGPEKAKALVKKFTEGDGR